MTIEDRLRQAIEARTRSVEPSPDARQRIANRLDQETSVDFHSFPTRTRWTLAAAAAVVLVVAAIAGGVLLRGDDAPDRIDVIDRPTTIDRTPPTTDEAPGTTTASTSPQTTAATGGNPSLNPDTGTGVDSDRKTAIWPRASSSVTFDTPEAVARSFARYYAHFDDPVIGTFQSTGASSRSGEVPVRAFAGGPATQVVVYQLGDGNWYVSAALAPDITLADPAAFATLVCPGQQVNGTALAFEGHVNVRIDAYQPDGDREELGRSYVTGSGSPPAGPFSGGIDCRYPTDQVEDYAVLTLWEESMASETPGTGTVQILSIPVALPG